MKQQSGFTLVEIAIVLVIVGLLLAGIIQGSALINSGTAKNLANELKTMPVYVFQYQDKFRALPGDDRSANTRFAGGALATTNGTVGNGRIEGDWAIENGTDESAVFWQHIRLAGLAAGSTVIAVGAYYPSNVVGGRVGVSSVPPIQGMTGSFFSCSGSIQGKYVRQIDANLDDGNTDQGSVRAAQQGAAPQVAVANAAIVDANSYNVCMAF